MYNTEQSGNLIQLQAGQNFTLKCGVLDDDTTLAFSEAAVTWYFKQSLCGSSSSSLSSCDNRFGSSDSKNLINSKGDDWSIICDNSCKHNLELNNLEPERDSGYYKCIIHPNCRENCSRSTDIQFVMTYHLVVLSEYKVPVILPVNFYSAP